MEAPWALGALLEQVQLDSARAKHACETARSTACAQLGALRRKRNAADTSPSIVFLVSNLFELYLFENTEWSINISILS